MLTPISRHEFLTKGSGKRVIFDCSCGRKGVLKIWKNFVNGHTTSCGRCGELKEDTGNQLNSINQVYERRD